MTTVLHLITSLGSGGAERMLVRIATAPRLEGDPRHVVVSLLANGMHEETLRAAGVEVHTLGMARGMPSPGAILRLVTILRRVRPDLMMTWLYHADLLGTLAAPLAGVRRMIWNLRCSDIDFSRYSRTTRWTVAALARLSRRPLAVASNSEAGRRAHEALGYRPRRWIYLPNGFDPEEWRPDAADRAAVRAEWSMGEGEVAIGLVARVDPQKDHATLIAAAERVVAAHPRARFVLIGRETEKLALPPALRDHVLVLGERRDLPRLVRGFDISVLSSAYGEGFPNVVGEAMASGVPCMVTDAGDAALVVGETGLTVPPRDPVALAGALGGMITEGPAARMARGQAARARIAEHWSIEAVLDQYRDVWRVSAN